MGRSDENHTMRSAVLFWCITAAYMALIFYLSSSFAPSLPRLPRHSDKLVHMLAYMPLAFLLYGSLTRSGLKKYVFIIAFVAAGLYGITDELHQSFVPGRDTDILDVVADFTGAFLGSTGARFIRI